MRGYAYSEEVNDPEVVTACYKYVKNASDTFHQLVMLWLQANDGDGTKKINPATPRVKLLLDNFHAKLKPKLERYHRKALLTPDERSGVSVTTKAKSLISDASSSLLSKRTKTSMSEASQEKMATMERNHLKAMKEMKDQLVALRVAHDKILKTNEIAENDGEKLKSALADVQNTAEKEKRELMKKHVEEKEAMMKEQEETKNQSRALEDQYGKLEREMRLSRDKMDLKKQEEIDKV